MSDRVFGNDVTRSRDVRRVVFDQMVIAFFKMVVINRLFRDSALNPPLFCFSGRRHERERRMMMSSLARYIERVLTRDN